MLKLKKYIQEIEDLPCNLCSSRETVLLCEKERFGLPLKTVMCKKCGLIYLNPRPSKKSYEEFCKSDYRKAVSGSDEGNDSSFSKEFSFFQRIANPFLQKNINLELKNILDIGCAYGGILKFLGEKYPSANLFGIEPVIKIAQYAREKTGARITTGLFEDFQSDKKFDLIVVSKTLNHTLDPKGNLLKIIDLLSERGVFLLTVHDPLSVLCIQPFSFVAELNHPFMFYREIVKYFLSRVGFEIIDYYDQTIANPSKEEMARLKFSKILVLARRAGDGCGVLPAPDWQVILKRIKQNELCREKWSGAYRASRRWKNPTFFLRVWRKGLKTLGLWRY